MSYLFDPDAATQARADPTLTVAQLSGAIRGMLQREFADGLWVAGQIRNLSVARSGHTYLDLVEPTEMGRDPEHRISVTLFKRNGDRVRRQLATQGGAVELEDGLEVRIGGSLNWYSAGGRLQFNMDAIDPAFTLGRLEQDRERLLRLLHTEGLLRANAAHAVPIVPLRVGIVTSETSAAAADVLKELRGSGFAFEIRLVDARTQGVDCGPSVVTALERLATAAVDVVLLVRGGGARTDLVGFDGEDIARAIAAMPVPVFTGIGHEIDRTIADEVAHTAHKTPTAAAGALVTAVRAFLERLDAAWNRSRRAALAMTAQTDGHLDGQRRRLIRAGGSALDRADRQMLDLRSRIVRAAGSRLDRANDRLDDRAATLAPVARRGLESAENRLSLLSARLSGHDPAVALARGWSVTMTEDGRRIRDPGSLSPGTVLLTRVAAGRITSTVTATESDPIPAPDPPAPDPLAATDPPTPSGEAPDAKGTP